MTRPLFRGEKGGGWGNEDQLRACQNVLGTLKLGVKPCNFATQYAMAGFV